MNIDEYAVQMGARLRWLREAADCTQRQFAVQLGLKAKVLSRYERGARIPDPVTVALITDATLSTPDYIYRGWVGDLVSPQLATYLLNHHGVELLDTRLQPTSAAARALRARFLGRTPVPGAR